jgi:hypothetical protein
MKASGQLHAPAVFTSGEDASGTHWIGGLVSPRAGLNALEKGKNVPLPGIEPIICIISQLWFVGRRCH